MDKITNIDWEKFHFLRPEYIWMAIPMGLIILLGILVYAEKSKWKKNIAQHLQPYVIQKGTAWKSRLIHVSLLLLFAIGFIAFLGPAWNKEKKPAKKLKSKLVIALDLSQSMLTTDISPTRLERAKFKIRDFLDANPRAETALQVFSASTHTVVPFTTDYKIILDQIDGLKPAMMPGRGTGFDALFKDLDSLFTGNKAEGKIMLITDDLNGLDVQKVSTFLQDNNVALYLYPISTQSGGEVPSFVNPKRPLKIKGKTITSQLDVDTEQALSGLKNLHIMNLTLDKSDVKTVAKEISEHLVFEDSQGDKQENWNDNGYWLMIPLVFFFLFSFRKGWALYSVLFMVVLGSSCGNNKESAKDTKTVKKDTLKFADLWYTKDYQGQMDFDKKDYKKAAKEFRDPLHKGVAYYKAGNYAEARKAFEQDSSSIGKYNLGLTYAKMGDLERSKKVFEELVVSDTSMANARNNLRKVTQVMAGADSMNTKKVPLNKNRPNPKNEQNKSMEDLGGGGQKATKKDMEKQRLEETTNTGKRIGKEMDEVPDDFNSGKGQIPSNVLMRKVDDDPTLFLTKKFKYQVKKKKVIEEKTPNEW
ncbi:VWA domain-containing protein [Flavobacteriaceae bacterium F89]|uniref:VWA domain-containing protein n=1 Tax=Cerina litoralis TaxID=2874477 RepID=A0AAE3EY32_9FLAO|nr:VWA domain-containing protein [Cerina litoralis]MCG2461706.1 VWA domain-containing protein [Cerina litoralis]